MQYKSLIRLLQHTGIAKDSEYLHNKQRLKKLLMAEFALEATGFITIDDFDYSKQEVLDELEHANFEQRLVFHYLIWNSMPLLTFLEKGESIIGLGAQCAAVSEDVDFVSFVSPYFAPAFNAEMKRRLAVPHFEAAFSFLPLCEMIMLSDGEVAFSSTRNFLLDSTKLFRNINAETLLSKKDQVTPWRGPWAEFLNKLPDEFYGLKDDLSNALINFLVEIQGADRPLTYAISKEMIKLDFLDPQDAELIRKNHLIYQENANVRSDSGSQTQENEKGNWRLIFVVFFLIMVYVRLIDKCNREVSSEQNNIELNNGITDSVNHIWMQDTRKEIKHSNDFIESTGYLNFLSPVYMMLQESNQNKILPVKIINETGQNIFCHYISFETMVFLEIESGKDVQIGKIDRGNTVDFVLSRDENYMFSMYDSIPKLKFSKTRIPPNFTIFSSIAFLPDDSNKMVIRILPNQNEKNWRFEFEL